LRSTDRAIFANPVQRLTKLCLGILRFLKLGKKEHLLSLGDELAGVKFGDHSFQNLVANRGKNLNMRK
jgi:hypothetical protein